SFLPLGLIPAAMPEARMPGTVVIPPPSHWMSGMRARSLRIHGRGFEPGSLVPPHDDVQVLHSVRRPAFTEIVERRYAHGPPGALVRDDRDVTEVGADNGPGHGALPLVEDAHERLAGVELAIECHEFARLSRSVERHRRGREQPAIQWHQMRRKGHDDRSSREARELLLDLGSVTMARDAIGLHVLVRLGVEVHRVDLASLGA